MFRNNRVELFRDTVEPCFELAPLGIEFRQLLHHFVLNLKRGKRERRAEEIAGRYARQSGTALQSRQLLCDFVGRQQRAEDNRQNLGAVRF